MSMRTIARSSSNRNSASALASSVLPTPVGPRNRNEPVGRSGSATPERARRTASDTARTASAWPTTRAAEPVLHAQQLLGLALEQPAGGDAGPRLDDVGDVVGADLLLEHRLPGLGATAVGLGERLLQLRQPAVAQLGGPAEVAVALGALGLAAQRLQLLLDPLDPLDGALVLLPAGGQLGQLLAPVGQLVAQRGQPLAARRRRPPWPAPSPRSPSGGRRARPRRPRPGGCRSPSAAGSRPRRPGRSPCPAGSGP